jgi:hypothetical protein
VSETPFTSLIDALERVENGLPGLDISADLTVHVAGHRLAVEAYTDRVFIDFPSLEAVVDVLRSTPDTGSDGDAGKALPAALAAADLTAVARVGAHEVATLGAGADGPLRYLGYEHLSVSAGNLLRVAVGF